MTARFLAFGTAKIMAMLGGLLLIMLIIVTCLSVLGRALNTIGNSVIVESGLPLLAELLKNFAPINGDFELVEMGIALSIFLFLPWCQLNKRHAAVDVFTLRLLSDRANALLLVLWEIALVFAIGAITVRLYAGMADRIAYNETTFLLQWPVWWAYAACTLASAIATLIGVYSVKLRINDIVHQEDVRQ